MRGRQYLLNLRPYTFWIRNDLSRGEANDRPTLSLGRRHAASVCFDLKVVMIAINLDHGPAGRAGEIGKVRSD